MPPKLKKTITKLDEMTCENCVFSNPDDYTDVYVEKSNSRWTVQVTDFEHKVCNQVFISLTEGLYYCYIQVEECLSDDEGCPIALMLGMRLLKEPVVQQKQYWRDEQGKVRL